MKNIFLFWGLFLLVMAASAQYTPVDEGSSVSFKVKNFGFNSGGFFTGLKGKISFDPARPGEAQFEVTIDASSVNTDNEARDKHLREDSYFDTQVYPVIHFQSTRVSAGSSPGNYLMVANLTIKKTTQEISFPFTARPTADGFLFAGEFSIFRKDFGVGGSSTISDKVEVSLSVKARRQ